MSKIFRNKNNSGMTLVELMVVLGIFLVLAGITVFDHNKFRSSVSLQNLADDIALSIRRAQNYAIGVHSAQSSVFSNGYGIHFSLSQPQAGDVRGGSYKSFVIFNDLPTANRIYDYPTSSSSVCNKSTLSQGNECVDILSITSNDSVYSICPNGINCVNAPSSTYVDINFIRPNPDAYIYICSGSNICSGPVSSVDLVIKNDLSQATKTISVSNVGQISIK